MHKFLATLARAPRNVGAAISVATFIVLALSGAAVISHLIGRVEKLESEIKSLRSDLDHPRIRPLASVVDAGHLGH
jgi:hypothetical protein